MSAEGKVSRRKFLGSVAAGVVVAGVLGGAVGYFSGTQVAPPQVAPRTVTATVTGAPTTTTVTQTVTAPTPKPPRTIKIGATVPMTGMFAPAIVTEAAMYKTWADMINERGGIYVEEYKARLPVEFIVYDDKSDVPTVQKFYEKLCVEDKVDILIGPFGPLLAIPASTIAERHATPYIDNQAAEMPIVKDKKWCVLSSNLTRYWSTMYLDMVKNDGRPKTLAILNSTDAFGKETSDYAMEYAPKLGLKVLLRDEVTFETVDFTPTIAKLKAADPDIVIFFDPTGVPQATFWKQAWDAGYKPRDYHPMFGATGVFQEAVGPKLGNYVTADVIWAHEFPYEGRWTKNFWLEVMRRSKFTQESYPWNVEGYWCVEIATAAIEAAGSLDKAKINQALRTMTTMTVSGPWRARKDPITGIFGVSEIGEIPVQMVDGKTVVLWPPQIRSGDYVYPAPWAR